MRNFDGLDALGFGMGGFMSMPGGFSVLVPIFIAWMLVWKGIALWHAAQRGQSVWFIVLLLINSLAILEIVYLFAILKLSFKDLFTSRIHDTNRESSESQA